MDTKIEQWRVRKPAVVSSHGGIVAAQQWRAARAGAEILKQGGNAVDAAVTTAFALNATEPWMCGLGGSGYMVVYLAGQQHAEVINFQGTVPAAIDLADYPLDPSVPDSIMGFPGVVDNRHVVGYGSISIPGAVAGLSQALAKFGTLAFDRVLAPAIDLAEQGLAVDWHTTLNIAIQMHELRKDPGAASVYLPNGCPAQPDTLLPLGNLPDTLRTLADKGPDEFYRGKLAELIAADLEAGGSAIRQEDLANYQAEFHQPLKGEHRGATVFSTDASGGAKRLLHMLQQVQAELASTTAVNADTYRVYANALNSAFAAHKRRTGMLEENGCTSHLSVVDNAGNMVALTYTLLNRFGSQVVLPRSGILMNNALSYFDPRPGRPTSLEGGKRINSSNMCPTIVTRNGQALFAVGASGANYIVPAVSQITALLLDYDMSLEQAFHTPRIDASDRGSIRADPAMPAEFIEQLSHDFELEIAQLAVFPKLYACPSAVFRDPLSGLNYGMTDPSAPMAAAWTEN